MKKLLLLTLLFTLLLAPVAKADWYACYPKSYGLPVYVNTRGALCKPKEIVAAMEAGLKATTTRDSYKEFRRDYKCEWVGVEKLAWILARWN